MKLLSSEYRVGEVILSGHKYIVRVTDGRRYIGDETIEAFIERMTLLGRYDVLAELAGVGRAVGTNTLDNGSPQMTAFALHQNRTKRN